MQGTSATFPSRVALCYIDKQRTGLLLSAPVSDGVLLREQAFPGSIRAPRWIWKERGMPRR